MDELLVSAPQYTDGTIGAETGRVYVYRNVGVSVILNGTHFFNPFPTNDTYVSWGFLVFHKPTRIHMEGVILGAIH